MVNKSYLTTVLCAVRSGRWVISFVDNFFL